MKKKFLRKCLLVLSIVFFTTANNASAQEIGASPDEPVGGTGGGGGGHQSAPLDLGLVTVFAAGAGIAAKRAYNKRKNLPLNQD